MPIFLSGHVVLVQEAFNISWPVFDEYIADALTVFVIAALVFFWVRRVVEPDVRFLTSPTDFFLIAVGIVAFFNRIYCLSSILCIQMGDDCSYPVWRVHADHDSVYTVSHMMLPCLPGPIPDLNLVMSGTQGTGNFNIITVKRL